MNERTIFLRALEQPGAAERAAFLAEACGPDAALRQRVEQLLQSHRDAGSFLGAPALGPETAATPGGATETHDPGSTGVDDVVLDALAPAEKPDSLGRLDHYEVLEVVGRGGMGVVLRAFDAKLHRVVALKVMARDIAGSGTARKRFSREAKAAAAVVHDHIVPIHAIEESGPTPYLVMQFVSGQSLQQKIDAEGSLELKEILRIGTQIASGLAAAHKQGLVHRDIKPSNILLENGVQRVKITDFGLARAVDDASVSQSGVVAGTPQYMSPEQADGRPVDHRSDLFSLGSVLYALCTGRPPFRAAGTVATLKRVCEDTPRPIRELNPDLPDWLSDIVGKLHAKKPAERFQSAREVADVLEQHLAHLQEPSQVAMPAPVRAASVAVQGASELPSTQWHIAWEIAGWLAGMTGLILGRMFGFDGWNILLSICGAVLLLQSAVRHVWELRQRRAGTQPTSRVALNRLWPHVALVALGLAALALLFLGPTIWLWLFSGQVLPTGSLEIGTDDPDLIVTLDGQLVKLNPITAGMSPRSAWGSASTGIVVRTGPHRVQALKEGKLVHDEVVEVVSGTNTRVFLSPRAAPAADGWTPLFNGRDLTGWKTHPRQPGNWRVENGILVGSLLNGNATHLFSERGDYQDFDLRADVQIDQTGNSGIYFRSPFELRFLGGKFPPAYEVAIYNDDSPTSYDAYKTGSIHAVKMYPHVLVKAPNWFALEVAVRGRHVKVRVNGTTTVDSDLEFDPNRPEPRGHIVLQSANGTVRFRKIEVREFPNREKPSRPVLDGRWVLAAAEYQGRPVNLADDRDAYPSELLFNGDRYGVVWAGQRHEGVVRVDPSKTPAELDFTGSVFDALKPRQAIYELDGDRLRVCLAFVAPNADPPRPTSFATDPESKNVVLTYRRAE